MTRFTSLRTKLQVAFLALGLTAIGITGWEASAGATAALREATLDRLTSVRQTRVHQIERWFQDLGNHTLALATDEATVSAVEDFANAWRNVTPAAAAASEQLRAAYSPATQPWFPALDRRAQTVLHYFLINATPAGARDTLLTAPGEYGRVHARYHPTLHRYQSAFGFYDVLLIGAAQPRVLYTVRKEVDLGMVLTEAPYASSALASIVRRANEIREPEQFVLQDFSAYLPSDPVPAAFVAAPVWRSGLKIGILVIQVSNAELNAVLNREHLGESGQTYIVGPDGTLRNDLRPLRGETPPAQGRSDILRVQAAPEAARFVHAAEGTEIGEDRNGRSVLRSHSRLNIPGLDWALMAEIDAQEAFEPATALRNRILGLGGLISLAFLTAATWLARSVTKPVLALAAGAQRLGQRDFNTKLAVESDDEIGLLAESFNRMAENLDRTTVSKEELERLAGKLITAQEDERQRVARELHDDLTQRLAAVAIEAGMLERETDPARFAAAAGRLKEKMAVLSRDVHGLSRRLHPAILADFGLIAAIESDCRSLLERGGPVVEFANHGDHWEALSKPVELAVYRIVQEALRNIERHAGAAEVWIDLALREENVNLKVRDNGRGFERNHPGWRAGLGLASMEERARSLGGRFRVESTPGSGTIIEVNIPCESKT